MTFTEPPFWYLTGAVFLLWLFCRRNHTACLSLLLAGSLGLVAATTLIAAIILGVAESIVLTMFGASWAPAISFAMLLGVLAVRPQGLLGR